MRQADRIRDFGRVRYVQPARLRKEVRFSIRTGDVVNELRLQGRTNAVCSALKTREFLNANDLNLVETSGPESGQSTTVVYTYEFRDSQQSPRASDDAWPRLRGALKDVFAELGGGETYLRNERSNFYSPRDGE